MLISATGGSFGAWTTHTYTDTQTVMRPASRGRVLPGVLRPVITGRTKLPGPPEGRTCRVDTSAGRPRHDCVTAERAGRDG